MMMMMMNNNNKTLLLWLAFRMGSSLIPAPAASDSHTFILMLLYADDLVLLADSAAHLNTAL